MIWGPDPDSFFELKVDMSTPQNVVVGSVCMKKVILKKIFSIISKNFVGFYSQIKCAQNNEPFQMQILGNVP